MSKKLEKRQTRWYGWKPDLPDKRDLKLTVTRPGLLPDAYDLTSKMPPVYDQGPLGSCTGNACAAAFEYAQRIAHPQYDYRPSRLFIYYGEREIEGTVKEDAGAYIRDGFKVLNNLGAPPESVWPYELKKFANKPIASVYKKALNHQVTEYRSVPRDLNQMCALLASGTPFVIGFSVYDSFESEEVAQTGHLQMPAKDEAMIGGHAVLVVGYNRTAGFWIVRNSWGKDWGINGYFTMPFQYLLDEDLSDDFWAVTKIEIAPASAK